MDTKQKIIHQLNISKTTDKYSILNICRALSVPERLSIIQLLIKSSLTVSEIAKKLDLPLSSTAFHVKTLEDAEIVYSEKFNSSTGKAKICFLNSFSVLLNFFPTEDNVQKKVTQGLALGLYSNCLIGEFNGLSSSTQIIGINNEKLSFYLPEHINADIIWMSEGWLEYHFANNAYNKENITHVNFSFEICSEGPNYRLDFPSDITFWINNTEVCTYTSAGDFGGRKGKLTPDWWPAQSTQYGLLTLLSVRKDGVYLNEKLINSNITVKDLKISKSELVKFKLGNKDNCKFKGGFNLFGKSFGDYDQDIIMEIYYI